MSPFTPILQWFDQVDSSDVESVGGKNASLGEMIRELQEEGIRVPKGFATTADAYWQFVEYNNIQAKMDEELEHLHNEEKSLAQVGKAIRRLFVRGEFPEAIADSIKEAYQELCENVEQEEIDVAVRSSATAEDLPESSFAGQQETYLNISGENELLDACRKCYASLFTNRAISYREEKGFDHAKVALSIGVQRMVRSDKSGSGVIFTIDTETGFPDVVVITAARGPGENEKLSALFDERNDAVKRSIRPLIEQAHEKDTKVGICGQAPSDYPEFAEFLVQSGIDSISLNPDSVINIIRHVAKIE